MKPGCTCLSHKEGLIISNGSEKIKNAHVLPREPEVQKKCCTQFSLIQVGALSIWSYSHWPILQEFCTEGSERVLRPSKGWSGVHLLHDNASSHKCEVVKSFLASEKVKVLNHPSYSPDLSPCDFFLFPRLKKMLSRNKYTSRSSLGSAIYQCLQQIPKEDYLLFTTG